MHVRQGRRLVVLAVAVLAIAAAGVVALLVAGRGSQSAARVPLEGETLALEAGHGRAVDDPSARRGRALRLFGNDSAERVAELPQARGLVVRAQGEQCEGSPRLVVVLDDRRVLAAPVTTSAWREYHAPVDVDAGRHRVTVAFADDHSEGDCDRNLVVDWLAFTGERPAARPEASADAPAPETTRAARRLLRADFTDGLREYPHRIHPERIRVVDDPVLGPARRVLRFEVHEGDTGPTENPRAQLETPHDFDEGEDRFFGFSLLFPESFPTELPEQAWVTLGEQAYGPNYDGAGGTSLRVQNAVDGSGAELRWQRNEAYDWDIPWRGPKIEDIRGRWVDVVQRIKLHRDPEIGFVELWMNTGSGWRRQRLDGQERLYMSTYDDANGGGANNSRLSLYYRQDIPGPLTLFHGHHSIATAGEGAFEAVAPRSYDR